MRARTFVFGPRDGEQTAGALATTVVSGEDRRAQQMRWCVHGVYVCAWYVCAHGVCMYMVGVDMVCEYMVCVYMGCVYMLCV